MIGIKASISMERTLFLDLPETSTEEEIINAAKQEIKLPESVLATVYHALRNLHINIPKVDIKDWQTTSVDYNIIK